MQGLLLDHMCEVLVCVTASIRTILAIKKKNICVSQKITCFSKLRQAENKKHDQQIYKNYEIMKINIFI